MRLLQRHECKALTKLRLLSGAADSVFAAEPLHSLSSDNLLLKLLSVLAGAHAETSLAVCNHPQ